MKNAFCFWDNLIIIIILKYYNTKHENNKLIIKSNFNEMKNIVELIIIYLKRKKIY